MEDLRATVDLERGAIGNRRCRGNLAKVLNSNSTNVIQYNRRIIHNKYIFGAIVDIIAQLDRFAQLARIDEKCILKMPVYGSQPKKTIGETHENGI
jgi:hypothetical protein